jgi:hypothetical protein
MMDLSFGGRDAKNVQLGQGLNDWRPSPDLSTTRQDSSKSPAHITNISLPKKLGMLRNVQNKTEFPKNSPYKENFQKKWPIL